MKSFQAALLEHSPPIPGLDNSIVVDPRRMHLTLGVMALGAEKTLESALTLLNNLKPRIMDILSGEKLRVDLNTLDIMPPDRGDLDKAHVLWMGPAVVDDHKLRTVCGWCPFK